MRRGWRIIAIAWLPFALACGGLITPISQDLLFDAAAELDRVPPSPERDLVNGWIEEAYVQVQLGKIGLWEISNFETPISERTIDGELSITDLAVIELNASFIKTPAILDSSERTWMLADLELGRLAAAEKVAPVELIDRSIRSAPWNIKGQTTFVSVDLPHWTAADLEQRLIKQGWQAHSCIHLEDTETRTLTCQAEQNPYLAAIHLVVYPDQQIAQGNASWDEEAAAIDHYAVLTISIQDVGEAVRLRDLLVSENEQVTIDTVLYKTLLRQNGWTILSSLNRSPMNQYETQLEISKGKLQGTIVISRQLKATNDSRQISNGEAWVQTNLNRLGVVIFAPIESNKLRDVLTRE